MAWRLANSLSTLRKQINAQFPARSRVSDGSIGDAQHASRSSDHNPWVRDGVTGVVTAIDITNDPVHGLSSQALAEALVESRDPRIKYIISNRRIISSIDKPWVWRAYNGKNPHNHHVHISVHSAKVFYDDTQPWIIGLKPVSTTEEPQAKTFSIVRKGSKDPIVVKLQELLGIRADGDFGPATEAAVKRFQKANDLVDDGIVGPYTWELLTK